MAALEESGQTAPRPADSGLADAVLDPYVNAIHVSLLREKRQNPAYARPWPIWELASRKSAPCAKSCWQKGRSICSARKSCSS
jgi:hypothetical protein